MAFSSGKRKEWDKIKALPLVRTQKNCNEHHIAQIVFLCGERQRERERETDKASERNRKKVLMIKNGTRHTDTVLPPLYFFSSAFYFLFFFISPCVIVSSSSLSLCLFLSWFYLILRLCPVCSISPTISGMHIIHCLGSILTKVVLCVAFCIFTLCQCYTIVKMQLKLDYISVCIIQNIMHIVKWYAFSASMLYVQLLLYHLYRKTFMLSEVLLRVFVFLKLCPDRRPSTPQRIRMNRPPGNSKSNQ